MYNFLNSAIQIAILSGLLYGVGMYFMLDLDKQAALTLGAEFGIIFGIVMAPFMMQSNLKLRYNDKNQMVRELVAACQNLGYRLADSKSSVLEFELRTFATLSLGGLVPNVSAVNSITATLDEHDGIVSGPRFTLWRLKKNSFIRQCQLA